MLTVTPSRRATMDDALRHWWVNFGHAQMPNGQPYNPCESDDSSVSLSIPPVGGVSLAANAKTNHTGASILSPLTTDGGQTVLASSESLGSSQHRRPRCHSVDGACLLPSSNGDKLIHARPPPAVIHQRNQSSLSSDSDAELDMLRSPRWENATHLPSDSQEKSSCSNLQHQQQPQQRRRGWRYSHQKTGCGLLDSTGNSVNSSGSASPASNMDDNNGSLHGEDSHAASNMDDNNGSLHVEDSHAQGGQTAKSGGSGRSECVESRPGKTCRALSLLKLPPSLLDILGGCSEMSLAALLSPDPDTNLVSFNPFVLLDNYGINGGTSVVTDTDNSLVNFSSKTISPSLDVNSVQCTSDVTNNNVNPSCTPGVPSTGPEPCTSTTTSSPTADTFVFDSERKPKRSILKRRGKFSGADPAKKAVNSPEDLEEDSHIPKSGGGHLPRRLPSFRDETHGIFASKHRASQLLEEAPGTFAPESCSSALLHSHPTPWGRHGMTSQSNTSPVCCSGETVYASSPIIQHPDPPPPSQPEVMTSHTSLPVFPHPQQPAPTSSNFCTEEGLNSPPRKHDSPVPVSLASTSNPISSFDPSQDIAKQIQYDFCDATNGNFPAMLVNDRSTSLLNIGNSVLAQLTDRDVVSEIANSEMNRAKDDILLIPSLSDLSLNCARNRPSASDATSAKPLRLPADNANLKTTSHGEHSANTSHGNPTPTQSANLSNRSSASNSSGDSAYDSSSLSSCAPTSTTAASSAKVIRRCGNILKTSQLEQARNRLSVSSIGSNSSADILDLSYDSGDSDHFANLVGECAAEQLPAKMLSESDTYNVATVMPQLDVIGAILDTQGVQTGLPFGQTSREQEVEIMPTAMTSTPTIDSDFTGLSPQDSQRPLCVMSEDVDLIIFPDHDEEENHPESVPAGLGAPGFYETILDDAPSSVLKSPWEDDICGEESKTQREINRHVCREERQPMETKLAPSLGLKGVLGLESNTQRGAETKLAPSLGLESHTQRGAEPKLAPWLGLESGLGLESVLGLESHTQRGAETKLAPSLGLESHTQRGAEPKLAPSLGLESVLGLESHTQRGAEPKLAPSLGLEPHAQRGVEQDQTDQTGFDTGETPDQVVNITENGSPLLYRLTREAQTWL
ncbi:hypothetical protein ElyMa_002161000 [Elysia marginata]|uniref:Protein kinase domain-containing protein n=1 Tax=Elysia marginata TaxID=1093978 RepID=A0AAV4FPS2_9GAST|nr:hypothetical protein ElyMa_002161000 [Elysia marginata]